MVRAIKDNPFKWIVGSVVTISFGALFTYMAWIGSNITDIPKAYATKRECSTVRIDSFEARAELESRMCERIERLEAQRKEDMEFMKEVSRQMVQNSKMLERIDERTKRMTK